MISDPLLPIPRTYTPTPHPQLREHPAVQTLLVEGRQNYLGPSLEAGLHSVDYGASSSSSSSSTASCGGPWWQCPLNSAAGAVDAVAPAPVTGEVVVQATAAEAANAQLPASPCVEAAAAVSQVCVHAVAAATHTHTGDPSL